MKWGPIVHLHAAFAHVFLATSSNMQRLNRRCLLSVAVGRLGLSTLVRPAVRVTWWHFPTASTLVGSYSICWLDTSNINNDICCRSTQWCMCVVLAGLALLLFGVSNGAWRLMYSLSILPLLGVGYVRRHLPETRQLFHCCISFCAWHICFYARSSRRCKGNAEVFCGDFPLLWEW